MCRRIEPAVRVAVDATPGGASEGRTKVVEGRAAGASGVVQAPVDVDAERFYQLVLRACTAC